MAIINFRYREIAVKVAYCGAVGANATMSVRTLHGMVPAREKGRLFPFGEPGSDVRACFFEYVPPAPLVPGFTVKVRVYAVPVGSAESSLREEVLGGADSVLLVIDPRPSRLSSNKGTVEELRKALRYLGHEPKSIPLLTQKSQTDFGEEAPGEDVAKDLGELHAECVSSTDEFFAFHDRLVADICARLKANLNGDIDAISLVADSRDALERDHELAARHESALEVKQGQHRPSLEHALKDVQMALTARYAGLSYSDRVEIPFQPKDFLGTRPVHVLGATLDGELIHVDVVMERNVGGEPRRLLIQLANRPRDAAPIPRHTAPGSPMRESKGESKLPERAELGPWQPIDFPPVWYGVAGAASGVLIGLLAGFLLLT